MLSGPLGNSWSEPGLKPLRAISLPCTDPQLRCQPSLNLNPVMPGSHGVIHPESPCYVRHPVSMVKAEQVRPKAPLFHGGVHLHTVSFPPRRLTGMERCYIQFYLVFSVNPVLPLIPQSTGLQDRSHTFRQIFSVSSRFPLPTAGGALWL